MSKWDIDLLNKYHIAMVYYFTERKRAQEDLENAKQQAELYLDLMCHDINNINQVVLGYLELARDMPYEARDKYLDKAAEALNRSTRLIGNVRKLKMIRDGREQLYDVDVCVVLGEVYREYSMAPGKKIALNLDCHKHYLVRANDLLHDVFSNLVGNAVKHAGDKVDVTIRLDVVWEQGVEYCLVSVNDNGHGIPDAYKDILFNRSLAGTPRTNGSGIGLYIVKTLVESYHGRVWVEDRVPGDYTQGTRFVVKLPAIWK